MPGPDSDIFIRPAVAGDSAALARLRYEFRAGVEPPAESESAFIERCTAWMGERLRAGASWRCWVAQASAAIVGSAWLQLIEKLPNPVAEPELHGYISSLYVQPAQRGAGVGSLLLAACLGECEAQAVDAAILWPTPRSRSLYVRHGFAVRDDLMERRG
ncbi:MAG: GNAT family N-acetyltransferase [Gemmatimonadales bacterium]